MSLWCSFYDGITNRLAQIYYGLQLKFNFFFFIFYYRMSVLRTLALLTIGVTAVLAQRRLALPDPRSCANRKFIFYFYFMGAKL